MLATPLIAATGSLVWPESPEGRGKDAQTKPKSIVSLYCIFISTNERKFRTNANVLYISDSQTRPLGRMLPLDPVGVAPELILG